MKAQALIELKGCTVAFGGSVALAEIDLGLHRGERLALVGSNGSGKTTLLRLLHGQLRRGEQVSGRRGRRAARSARPWSFNARSTCA
jgi:tungstate transport system ATP-binding protein